MKFYFITLTFISSFAFSQNCEKVLVTGRVMDTLRPQGFYNLMVINRNSGQGVFGQPNGAFSVYANNNDTLTFSVKDYPKMNLRIVADSNCQFRTNIYIEGKAQEVAQVNIKPLKTLEQIKEERSSLALRETRQVTGIDMLQSPITAIYQAFSRKEKNKRWIAQKEYADDQERIVKELLELYVSYDIIDLSDAEFDDFISFLNVDENFLKTASETELITFIKDKYEHFKSFK